MILGVAATICAGKDTVADYLIEKGFSHVSFSDYLRAELRKQGKEVTLQGLADLGNTLRSQYGPGVLAQRLLSMMDPAKQYVITSFRNPEEVQTIKNARDDFVLIALDADRGVRWQRMQTRSKKENEPSTYEEFISFENAQYSSDPAKMNLGLCMNMADIRITNDGSLDELYKKIDSVVNRK